MPVSQEWVDRAKVVRIEDELARRRIPLKGRGRHLNGPCPKCGGDDRFWVDKAKRRFGCRHCHEKGGDVIAFVQWVDGCNFGEALDTLVGERPKANGKGSAKGKPEPKPVESHAGDYDYCGADGLLLFQVQRFNLHNADGTPVLKDGKPDKTFRQRRPDPDRPGQWIKRGPFKAVLYRLPGLLADLQADPTTEVYLVEGEAKVDLLRDKWNLSATCNAQGGEQWKDEHSAYLRDANVTILPDNDEKGRRHLNKVAKSLHSVGARVRLMELPDLPPKGDIVDWIKAGHTREEFLSLADKVREWMPHVDDDPPTAPNDSDRSSNPPSKFNLINIDDIEIEDEPARLIENLMPAGPGLLVFAGPPKTLKSFVLMYALLHVAAGLKYAGCKVQQGVVIYVTSEGVRGAKRRLVAMRKHLGIHGNRVPFFLVSVMPNLGTGSDDAKALIAAIKSVVAEEGVPVRAVAIDTLRRANPGKDENNTKDMSMFIDNCGAIADSFQCLTAAIHRSPRSAPDRSAGTNAIDAAMDCLWTAKREDNGASVTVTVAWMKDGDEEGYQWTSELVPVPLGKAKDGSALGSCAMNIVSDANKADVDAKPKTAKPIKDDQAAIALHLLHECLVDFGKPHPGNGTIPAGAATCDVAEWRSYCASRMLAGSDKPKSFNTAFNRASSKLQRLKRIGVYRGLVWSGDNKGDSRGDSRN